MDTLDSSRKIPKFKSLNGSASPINTRLISESSLMKYLCGGSPITSSVGKSNGNGNDGFSSPAISAKSSRGSSGGRSSRSFGSSLSPLSSVENVMSPSVFGTPAKVVDEDVLVMDGFLVQSTSGGRVSRSLSSDSGGSSSNSFSSPGIRVPKAELCRSWEDFGNCRFGSKCQFAHGKEELRPTCFSMKNKAETQSFKSHTAGSYSYAHKSSFLPPVMAEEAVAANRTASASKPEFKEKNPANNFYSEYSSKNTSSITRPPLYLSRTPAFIKPELSNKSPTINIKSQEWTPLDDGIEVALPDGIDKCSSDRKDVGAYIHGILHGPRARKRLPVFTEFCLD